MINNAVGCKSTNTCQINTENGGKSIKKVEEMSKKISSTIGALRRVRTFMSESTALQICQTLIYPTWTTVAMSGMNATSLWAINYKNANIELPGSSKQIQLWNECHFPLKWTLLIFQRAEKNVFYHQLNTPHLQSKSSHAKQFAILYDSTTSTSLLQLQRKGSLNVASSFKKDKESTHFLYVLRMN